MTEMCYVPFFPLGTLKWRIFSVEAGFLAMGWSNSRQLQCLSMQIPLKQAQGICGYPPPKDTSWETGFLEGSSSPGAQWGWLGLVEPTEGCYSPTC